MSDNDPTRAWLASHLPHPLNAYAILACFNCMEFEHFMPAGVILTPKGAGFEIGLVPCVAGFREQGDKEAFIDAIRAVALKQDATMTLWITEAWTYDIKATTATEAQAVIRACPRASTHPDRIEVILFNWEHYDPHDKVIAEQASFKIIREGGKKVNLEFLRHMVDRNGGNARIMGTLASILMPREAACA